MKISLNGQDATIDAAMSLAEFVTINLKGKEPRGVAAALNDMIIPKQKWEQTMINENDSIEIVHAVQGG